MYICIRSYPHLNYSYLCTDSDPNTFMILSPFQLRLCWICFAFIYMYDLVPISVMVSLDLFWRTCIYDFLSISVVAHWICPGLYTYMILSTFQLWFHLASNLMDKCTWWCLQFRFWPHLHLPWSIYAYDHTFSPDMISLASSLIDMYIWPYLIWPCFQLV